MLVGIADFENNIKEPEEKLSSHFFFSNTDQSTSLPEFLFITANEENINSSFREAVSYLVIRWNTSYLDVIF